MNDLLTQARKWFMSFGSWNGVTVEGAFTSGYIKGWKEAEKAYQKNIKLLFDHPPQNLL